MIYRLRSSKETGSVINFGRDKDLRMLPFGPPEGSATPIKFKVAPGVGSSKMTDVLYCGTCPPIFSARMADAFQDILGRDGKLFEAAVVGAKNKYFVFAPRRSVDCIDESKSRISRTAYVTHVDTAAFKSCDLDGADIFLAKNFEWSGVFVSDFFVKRFNDHKFTGAFFATA